MMRINKNTKFVILSAIILVIVVGCSVAVARVIIDDQQSDTILESEKTSIEKLSEIRALLNNAHIDEAPLHAYIIPSVDAHQSEYIARRDRRIAYISGFTGSAGTAIIAADVAALWTDSRYHIQAEQQLDLNSWQLMKSGLPDVPTTNNWLISTLPPNSRIGIDPFLIDSTAFQSLASFLEQYGHQLVEVSENLVDWIWDDRPELELPNIEWHEYKYSGKIISDKLAEVRKEMETNHIESLVEGQLDNIAWLLNLRGMDIIHNPVFYSYVIITQSEVHLYVLNATRITPEIESHFVMESVEVTVHEYEEFLEGITNTLQATTGRMGLSHSSQAISSKIPRDRQLVIGTSILTMLKVVKNSIEAEGLRKAHIRDGAAVVKYLHWLDNNIDSIAITEISGAAKLDEFRSLQVDFKDTSFGAISAVGSNAAMAHYDPSNGNDKRITRDEIYLIDSGGQYLDGTTDVTRTVHFGEPNDEEKDAFTRVLKGAISLSTAYFPPKAPLSFFDAMARRALWDVGLDYGHGTGHGIGAFLGVHEYPPRISNQNDAVGMLENMFTSNEPGYYKEGHFGIRIEDIVQVVKAPRRQGDFDGLGTLVFYDITLVPIQLKLIKFELLSRKEVDWLNAYHKRVFDTIRHLLTPAELMWLENETQSVGYSFCEIC